MKCDMKPEKGREWGKRICGWYLFMKGLAFFLLGLVVCFLVKRVRG